MQKLVDSIDDSIETAIFCGDAVAPFMSSYFKELNIPVYACLGNNDEDHIGLLKMGGENVHWTNLSQEYGEVELGGKKIAFCHYPKLGELLAGTGDYDLVCHGHTHVVRSEFISSTLLCNPGSVCGIKVGRPIQASYAVYDTSKNAIEITNID